VDSCGEELKMNNPSVERNLSEASSIRELLDYLKKELEPEVCKVKVENVCVGLIYTGVVLSSGHAGVAYTPVNELSTCPVLPYAGKITNKLALEIAEMSLSPNLVEAALGVATINALSQIAFEKYPEKYVSSKIDVSDLIQHGDKVVMVGYFGPLVPKVLRKTGELYILEKKKVSDSRVKLVSQSEAPKILHLSDVALISGSTLVNKTIDDILKHVTESREVVLLGPTASVVPYPLFKKGVTAVMGIKITDPEKMLRIVSEAGGTRELLSSCAEKTAFLRGESVKP